MFKNKLRGFTLIELLIVIAILAMLMTVVLLLIKPRELLDRSRTTAAGNYAAKLCNAIQVCQTSATNGVCTTMPDVSVLPTGVASATPTDTLVTVTSAQSSGTACSITCNPLDGKLVYAASCQR